MLSPFQFSDTQWLLREVKRWGWNFKSVNKRDPLKTSSLWFDINLSSTSRASGLRWGQECNLRDEQVLQQTIVVIQVVVMHTTHMNVLRARISTRQHCDKATQRSSENYVSILFYLCYLITYICSNILVSSSVPHGNMLCFLLANQDRGGMPHRVTLNS